MLRAFLKDSVVYGAAGILSRGISLLLVPLYTRVLSPGDYGTTDILLAFAALVNLTVALEVSQGVARYYPDAASAEEKGEYASTALWFTLAAYTVFWAVAALGARGLSGMLLDSPEKARLVHVSLAAIWAGGVFYLVQNQLRWELRAMRYAIISVVMTLVTAGVSVALVIGARMGVAGVLWGQCVGSCAGAALGVYYARESYAHGFSREKLARMLRFSVPLVPSSIAVFVALYVDRFAIKELMTLHDVGLFGVGYRVASLAGLLMLGFQGALTPLVFTHYRSPETPGTLARLFRWFVAFALMVVVGLSLFAPEFLRVFTTPAYADGARVVPLLAPAVVLSGMYIFAPGLALAKRTGGMALITTAGALLNTGLNFLLVPRLGIVGAAAATFSSALLVFGMYMAASQRLYPVPHRWPRIAAAVLCAAAVMAVAPRLRLDPFAAVAAKAGLLALCAALLVAAGVVEAGEVRRAWRMARARLSRPRPAGEAGLP